MTSLDNAVSAKYSMQGLNFEILVDCEKALDYRVGKLKDIENALVSNEIYTNVRKVEKATLENLRNVFKTEDLKIIADLILKKGEIQLTVEHKQKIKENLRKQIIDFIHKNSVDPINELPHPPQRIEKAMEEAKVKLDENEKFDFLVQHVITAIRPLLRIKLETREVEVLVNVKDSSAVINFFKKKGTKILKEQQLATGNFQILIEIPAGVQEEIETGLNNITKGDAEIKILNKK